MEYSVMAPAGLQLSCCRSKFTLLRYFQWCRISKCRFKKHLGHSWAYNQRMVIGRLPSTQSWFLQDCSCLTAEVNLLYFDIFSSLKSKKADLIFFLLQSHQEARLGLILMVGNSEYSVGASAGLQLSYCRRIFFYFDIFRNIKYQNVDSRSIWIYLQ